ncbi:MAG: peptide deformylase [Coxiellaceae bacterium]|nr:peptide deformylase [Coxiellaceae bacterium]
MLTVFMNKKIQQIENEPDQAVLTAIAERATFPLSKKVQSLVDELLSAHIETNGVGLAAPQIGISMQFFVVEITEEQASLREHGTAFPRTVFFNPKYTAIEGTPTEQDIEACFSVRDTAGWVPRHHAIQFDAQDSDGNAVSFIAEGFLARALQHETDHLQGVLITDLLTGDCLQGTPEAMYAHRRDMLSTEKAQQLDQLRSQQKK